jgi:hypothetical protein
MNSRGLAQRGKESDAQGRWGEKQFSLWATESGVTANVATEDRTGWDFLLDFPPVPAAGKGLSCKVQVKTIGRKALRTKLTLSNWRTMITDALPWFVVVIRMSRLHVVDSVFVFNVTGPALDNVVETLSKTKRGEALNKRHLFLQLKNCTLIPNVSVNPQGLFDVIRKAIGDQTNYIQQKKKALNQATSKWPEGRLQLIFRSDDLKELHRQQSEWAVGIRSTLPVAQFQIENRFLGIEDDEPKDGQDAEISLPSLPSTGKSKITVDHSQRKRVAYEFETFPSSAVLPFLPLEFSRVRLIKPPVSVDLHVVQDSLRMNVQFSLEKLPEHSSAKSLGESAAFFGELLVSPGPDSKLHLLMAGAQSEHSFKNTLQPKWSESLELALGTYCRMWRILQHLALEDELVSVSELHACEGGIRLLAAALPPVCQQIEISSRVEHIDALLEEEKPVSFLFIPGFPTQNRVVLGAVEVTGMPTRLPEPHRITIGNPLIQLLEIKPVIRRLGDETVRELREKWTAKIQEKGESLVVRIE